MMTTAFLESQGSADFDWIYVDADHSYEAVVADIAAALPRVKPGGMLVFNDFARIVRKGFGVFGVQQAVAEFAVRSGWQVAFFCLNGEALYDIALRRPAEGAG
jgi:predicted O-methyltransferase YrrM